MQIRIISLGEIVTPNLTKTIHTFASLIASKKKSSDLAEIAKTVSNVLPKNIDLIDNFKLGVINENDFTTKMISVLQEATQMQLTVEEFDNAWKMMNPDFAQFETSLKQAIAYNKQPNQKTIFISFTNPKDIRSLIEQLQNNNLSYKVEHDELTEIDGITLFTTYVTKQSKAELIAMVIKQLRARSSSDSAYGTPALFQELSNQSLTIKYIRGLNNINDPFLNNEWNKTNQAVENQASALFVDTLLWKKCEQQTLVDILNNNEIVSRQISVAKL